MPSTQRPQRLVHEQRCQVQRVCAHVQELHPHVRRHPRRMACRTRLALLRPPVRLSFGPRGQCDAHLRRSIPCGTKTRVGAATLCAPWHCLRREELEVAPAPLGQTHMPLCVLMRCATYRESLLQELPSRWCSPRARETLSKDSVGAEALSNHSLGLPWLLALCEYLRACLAFRCRWTLGSVCVRELLGARSQSAERSGGPSREKPWPNHRMAKSTLRRCAGKLHVPHRAQRYSAQPTKHRCNLTF